MLTLLSVSSTGIAKAKVQTIANDLANQKMEKVRNMHYEHITTNFLKFDLKTEDVVEGYHFTSTYEVTPIDDPSDNIGVNDEDGNTEDYKKVVITVESTSKFFTTPSVTLTSYIGPFGEVGNPAEIGPGNGQVIVKVYVDVAEPGYEVDSALVSITPTDGNDSPQTYSPTNPIIFTGLTGGTYKIVATLPDSSEESITVVLSNDEGWFHDSFIIFDRASYPADLTIIVRDLVTQQLLPGATVRVTGPAYYDTTLITDAQGQAVFTNLEGSYNAEVSKTGYLTETLSNILVMGSDVVEVVDLEPDVGGPPQGSGSLEVKVEEKGGKHDPIPGARVEISNDSGYFEVGFTDDKGKVLFENLVPGDYTVTASKDGYNSDTQTATVQDGKKKKIKMRLQPSGGILTVRVIDEKNNQPIQDAKVRVYGPDGSHDFDQTLNTDSQGVAAFNISDWGTYQVEVEKSGYKNKKTNVEVNGGNVLLTIKLKKK